MTREEKFTKATTLALSFLWNEHRAVCRHFAAFLISVDKHTDADFSNKAIYFIKRLTMNASTLRMNAHYFNKYVDGDINKVTQDAAFMLAQETIEMVKKFAGSTNKQDQLNEYIDALMELEPYKTHESAEDDYYHIEKQHIRFIYEFGESYLAASSRELSAENMRYMYIATCGSFSVFYRAAVEKLQLPTRNIDTVKGVYKQVQNILSAQNKRDIEFVLGSLVNPSADA